jgi:Mn2+/Fe2+ NRAMP family transporter
MDNESSHQIREAPRGFGGLLRNIGPGIVVSGSVVGSGELLVTTRMGAEVGFVFLWGVIVASVIKYFIQLELGRQCLLKDETTIQSLDRVRGFRLRDTSWNAWLCIAGFLGVMVALVGILGSVGGMMSSVFPWLPKWTWNCVIFALLSVLLYRGLYEDLEKMVSFLVAAFSLVVIFCVLALQGTEHAITGGQIVSGLRLAMPAEGAFTALAVMGSVGATAVELFMYPYWIREKGYPQFIGPRDDSPEWRERYRGWMRVVAVDAGVCTGIAVVITCAYYLLGASILNKLEVLPEGYEVVDNVSLIFTESLGGWAKNLFMFGAFCTLFSTLLVFAASSGRIMLDFLRQTGAVAPETREQRMRLLRVLQIGIPLLWLIGELAYAEKPFLLLRLGANCNNLLLIPLAFGVLHLAMRLDGRVRMPMSIELGLMATIWAVTMFTGFNLFQLWGGGGGH